MKRIKLMNVFSWVLTHISWMTMVFSPLAYGKQAENITAENLKLYAQEFGLNKKTTLAEFWEKSKAYYPGYMYKEIETFVQKNPNMLMPQIEIKTSKSSAGENVPTLYMTENGKTQTIQFYGESGKFIKFNGVTLSEKDTQVPQKMFKKILAVDSKTQKQYSETIATDKLKHSPFPTMTSKLWKTMTVQQRATYFIQMRMMYLEAEKVISEKETKKEKKSSTFSFIEYIFKTILPEAGAETAVVARPVKLPDGKGKTVQTKQGQVKIPYDAKSCIVAGYIGAYTTDVSNVRGDKRPGCSVDVAIATYAEKSDLSYVKSSNDQCVSQSGSNSVACNPMVYGTPNGSPICIDKKAANFQVATHWDGPCDTQSRLSSSSALFDVSGKDYSKIQPRESQIAEIKKDQAANNFQLTKDFISGILASKDKDMLALFKDGKWSPDLEKEILRINDHFKTSIDKALEICEKEITAKHEANQRGACDQLHRRYLFVDEVIAGLKKPEVPAPGPVVVAGECPSPQSKLTEDGEGNKVCECVVGKSKDQSRTFGVGEKLPAWCSDSEQPPVKPEGTCDKPKGISDFNYEKCECAKGTLEVSNEPNKLMKFFGSKSPEKGQEKYECESGPNWLLIGGLGLAALGLFAFLNRDKKPKQPDQPPQCPAGTTGAPPNCFTAARCPSGTSGTPPNCFSTAQCPAGTTGNPPNCFVAATCPAGTTGTPPKCFATASCPAGTTGTPPNCYAPATCQGAQILLSNGNCGCANAASCTSPAGINGVTCVCTAPPNEGGTGNNTCANPPCSGGVPTTKTGK